MKRLLIILLLAASAAQAETYEWTDREGTVHFSESRAEIPAPYRKSATPLGIDVTGSGSGPAAAVSSPATRQGTTEGGSVADRMEEVKGRLQNDEGSMALIRQLQDDPQMQALLSDPAVLRAVQAGDYGALMNNPAFLKLLTNPRVQQIEKRLQQGGTK
ncbi:DUF4124 domain-containing protein [Oryzomonas sagensis]|uniref:DUF4124 domain-containing protein n=1 Tax=Oryzomonas sagensis TaxID=2603857 RepID=A0ABQ6TNK2_9BACT|nr:DUF4124 domain-containing protein [Oryzomonas sagensis]KAB0670227.1 DUF4124 domain-containing protein [Oryzomonas sagensis]